jgi:hypothetical protein
MQIVHPDVIGVDVRITALFLKVIFYFGIYNYVIDEWSMLVKRSNKCLNAK